MSKFKASDLHQSWANTGQLENFRKIFDLPLNKMFRISDQNKKFRWSIWTKYAGMLEVYIHFLFSTREGKHMHMWERESVRERIARDSFPSVISNLLKIEMTVNSVFAELVLFSREKKGKKKSALAKNIHSYSELELSTSVVSFSKRHFASHLMGLLPNMSIMKLDTTEHWFQAVRSCELMDEPLVPKALKYSATLLPWHRYAI